MPLMLAAVQTLDTRADRRRLAGRCRRIGARGAGHVRRVAPDLAGAAGRGWGTAPAGVQVGERRRLSVLANISRVGPPRSERAPPSGGGLLRWRLCLPYGGSSSVAFHARAGHQASPRSAELTLLDGELEAEGAAGLSRLPAPPRSPFGVRLAVSSGSLARLRLLQAGLRLVPEPSAKRKRPRSPAARRQPSVHQAAVGAAAWVVAEKLPKLTELGLDNLIDDGSVHLWRAAALRVLRLDSKAGGRRGSGPSSLVVRALRTLAALRHLVTTAGIAALRQAAPTLEVVALARRQVCPRESPWSAFLHGFCSCGNTGASRSSRMPVGSQNANASWKATVRRRAPPGCRPRPGPQATPQIPAKNAQAHDAAAPRRWVGAEQHRVGARQRQHGAGDKAEQQELVGEGNLTAADRSETARPAG